jgi:tRNA dimethylallyltransferase
MGTQFSPDRADGKQPLALIAGPTASGKSDLAVELALRVQATGRRAVVINADSAQVYRDLAVLSARPTEADMRGIEHRLFGERDGALVYSAADWAAAAKRIILLATLDHDTVPILVGGSGLYIRALLDGIAPIPRVEPAIREEVRALSVEEAYAALRNEDPDVARMLNPADSARVARALEVSRSSGYSINYWRSMKTLRLTDEVALSATVLLPEREALYARCDQRFAVMLNRGAVDEVEALLARNLDPDLPVMRAIGVREIAAMLRGEITREAAIARASQATRNYAKRQYTWFRRQPPPEWPRIEYDHSKREEYSEIIFQTFRLT